MAVDPGFLANISLFVQLDDDERSVLASAMQERAVEAGETLFRAGDPGDSMFIVQSGRVELFVKDKAAQTAGDLGIQLGRVVSVAESPGGYMWNQTYFPQAANVEVSNARVALGGTMQPLTLEVTIGYELSRKV